MRGARTSAVLWTARQAAAADRHTIARLGMSSAVLMERAALCVSAVVEEVLDEAPAEVHVLCGPGNNGGDGLAVARLLRGRGYRVIAHLAAGAGNAAVAEQLAWARAFGVPVHEGIAAHPDSSLVVVDALLGTGSRGEPRAAIADALAWIRAGDRVVAVDLPTGVDVDTGAAATCRVRAQRTVTFQRSKPGLHLPPGRALAGRVHVAEIGLIEDDAESAEPGLSLIDPLAVAAGLAALPRAAHKGAAGHLAVLGGAAGTPGAAVLAGEAALRAGAGLVTICSPDPAVQAQIVASRPELMATPAGAIPASATALVVGPGLVEAELRAGLLARARDDARPAVWDAGALDGLEIGPGRGPRVLTPHPGEAARLMSRLDSSRAWTPASVQAARLEVARALAAHFAAVVVLKGEGTLVAAPTGSIAIDLLGTAALATAGTGDVLAGAIGGLLARGLDPLAAAKIGVCLHSCAGRVAAGRGRLLAGEVAEALAVVEASEFAEIWPAHLAG